MALELRLNFHRVVHPQEEVTRILQAPIDERHAEFSTAAPVISGELRANGEGKFVLSAVQHKDSVHLSGEDALRGDGSFDAVRAKDHLRIALTFENFLVHFLVARVVVGLATGRVRHDFPACLAIRGIEMNGSALQCKRPMHRVQGASERPIQFASRRIDSEDDLIRWNARRGVLR